MRCYTFFARYFPAGPVLMSGICFAVRTRAFASDLTLIVFCLSACLMFPVPSFAQSTPGSTVPVRIIVVESESDAQQILKRLQTGADFASMAKEKSIDVTAQDGGFMGKVDPASLRNELRNAILGLAPGQISGIIRLPSSFAILQLLSSVPVPARSTSSSAPTSSSSGGSVPTQSMPLTARGSIRYLANVGGKGEADLAFRSYPKPDGWSQDLKALCQIRKDSLSSVIDLL